MEVWQLIDLERKTREEIKLKKKLASLHFTIQQMSELFYKFVQCTQDDLTTVSSLLGFLYDEHIKDYRKFTIKKERNSIDEHIAKEIIRRHKQLAKYSEEKDNE